MGEVANVDPAVIANARPVGKVTICPSCKKNIPVSDFPAHFAGHAPEKQTKEEKIKEAEELKKEKAVREQAEKERQLASRKPTPLTGNQKKKIIVETLGAQLSQVLTQALEKIDSEEKASKDSEETEKVRNYYKGVSEEFLSGEPVKLEESFESLVQINPYDSQDPDIQQLRGQALDQVYAESYKLKHNFTRVIEVNKNQSQEIQALRTGKRDYNESVSFGVVGYGEDHRYILEEKGRNYRGLIRNWGPIIILIILVALIYEYESNPQFQAQIAQFWANDLNKAIVVIVILVGFYIAIRLRPGRNKSGTGAV